VLGALRSHDGGPALRVRILAALVALGLLLGSAPVLVPVLRWVIGLVL